MPEFKGFLEYIKRETHYPVLAKEIGLEGTVYVNFIIDQTGSVTNINILNPKANELFKKEATRVMGKCPKWKPGSDGTRNVRVSMTVPLRFSLD